MTMLRKLSLVAALTAALAFPADALARAGRGVGFNGGYRYHGVHRGYAYRGYGVHRGYGYRGYGYRGYRGYGYGAGYCRVWTPVGTSAD
jgi:hypothetical protein